MPRGARVLPTLNVKSIHTHNAPSDDHGRTRMSDRPRLTSSCKFAICFPSFDQLAHGKLANETRVSDVDKAVA